MGQADATADGASDPVAGRCLGTEGITIIAHRLQEALIARGYITSRVETPAQDLTQGQLVLTLHPGRIQHIQPAGPMQRRATLWNAFPMRSGDILNLRDVEQGLENLRRLPTAEAQIRIEPASEDGSSALTVAYHQGFPLRAQITLDDGGSKATGKYQGGLTIFYDNWWTLNDRLYVSLGQDLGGGHSGSKGSRNRLWHYEVPLGYWSLAISHADNDYHQSIAGATQDYRYSGHSRQTELRISRVLWRNARHRFSVTGKWQRRRSSNFIDDTEVEVQRRATGSWELGAQHRAWLGEGVLDANVAYRRGTGAFGAQAAPEEPFGEGTSRFKLLTASLQLAKPFELAQQRLGYSMQLRLQYNRTPLAPQERFSIGGRYTVRGFDGEQTLMADRGVLLRNELSAMLGHSGQQAYLGLDWGRVGGPSARWLGGTSLAGAVLGMRGSVMGASYEVFAGAPLHKPRGFETARISVGFQLAHEF
nr:ShlB/FhaC/HecB family hemolysin secretion/activation protein [Corticibacter populi]